MIPDIPEMLPTVQAQNYRSISPQMLQHAPAPASNRAYVFDVVLTASGTARRFQAFGFAGTSTNARQDLTVLTAETARPVLNPDMPHRCNFWLNRDFRISRPIDGGRKRARRHSKQSFSESSPGTAFMSVGARE